MNDDIKELLLLILTRLEKSQAETNEKFAQMQAENTRNIETLRSEITQSIQLLRDEMNQRFEQVDQRFKQIGARFRTLEGQLFAIGSELKNDIIQVNDKIERMQIEVYRGRADQSQILVDFSDLRKRVAALEEAAKTF